MPSTRTQVYLTQAQRRRLDEHARNERKTLAHVIRDAVDAYLEGDDSPNREATLTATFGAIPSLEIPPRTEWDRGYG